MAQLTAADRRFIGHSTHEAAHAVIAAVHGATVDSAEVLRSGPATDPDGISYYGRTRYRWDPSSKQHRDVITAAGTAGEAIWVKGKPTVTDVWRLLQASSHDFNTLRQLSYAKGQNPMAALETVLPMVNRLWPNIAQLANQLRAVREVTNADVLKALGIPSADEAPRYAHAIRNGAVPGDLHVGGRRIF